MPVQLKIIAKKQKPPINERPRYSFYNMVDELMHYSYMSRILSSPKVVQEEKIKPNSHCRASDTLRVIDVFSRRA